MIRIWLILTIAVATSIGGAIGGPRSCAAAATLDHRYDAQTVFRCTFDATNDADANGWPDDWARERSPAYPRYVEVRIDSTAPSTEGRSLRMELDGGGAVAYSPPIPTSASFEYVFEALVQTEALVHDQAFISVTFYDAQNKLLERCVSSPVEGATAWTRVRIGPAAPTNPATHHAVIGLHLEPAGSADLRGTAWFGDVWAGQLPRVALEVNRSNHLYAIPDQPQVVCTASGFADAKTKVDFQLLDVDGHEIQRARLLLELDDTNQSAASTVFSGHAVWRPALPDVGFYHVRCSLNGQKSQTTSPEVTLALIRPEAAPKHGEFGWALSQGKRPLALDPLADLVEQSAIGWLKIPLWNAGSDPRHCELLAAFAERLQNSGVKVVGVLAEPPADVRKQFDSADPLVAAQIFSAKPEVWFPSLEPIVGRLSQTVHDWQLGTDGDFSFVNFGGTTPTIESVRKQLVTVAPKFQLGCSWPLNRALPAGEPNWNFIALSAAPYEATVETAPAGENSETKTRRWVFVEPLVDGSKSATQRATDLAQQMLAAKLQQADGIFMPNVFSSQRGLLNDDGAVAELLLPWRTTALALGGAEYVGKLQLPHGSTNHIFSHDHQLVMMLWNNTPSDEQVSLGDKLRQINLWGVQVQPLSDEQGRQRVRADSSPSYITGLNEPLVRWQMAVALAISHWPTTFGEPLSNALTITNTFPQSVTGTVRCVLPEHWRMTPRELTLKLPAGETGSLPFEVQLPLDASSGPQEVRLDFDITAERRYQFSVYRTLEIGDHAVYAEVTTRLDDTGDLVVEQKLVNATEQSFSFRCALLRRTAAG